MPVLILIATSIVTFFSTQDSRRFIFTLSLEVRPGLLRKFVSYHHHPHHHHRRRIIVATWTRHVAALRIRNWIRSKIILDCQRTQMSMPIL